MKNFLLSNDLSYANECPFGVSFVSGDQLKVPQTHLMFITSDSTCFVDISSNLPVDYLPVVTKAVRIVPIMPNKVYDSSVLSQLMHLYPTHAAALRRSYMYGEETFETFVKGLAETYQWDNSVKTYLGGLKCLA